MEPGVYAGLTSDEYHGGPGTNKGLLDIVARSPLHAKAVLDRVNDNDPTLAMVIGTAFHTLVLEPHLFADEYVCELTQADAPHAIADRQVLVDMVEKLNEGRLPKLSTSGTKPEMIARIEAAAAEQGAPVSSALADMGGKELKDELEELNRLRLFPLATTGTMTELRDVIAAETGKTFTLWSEVRARWAAENENYTVLSVDTYNQLLAMAAAVKAHPSANALLYGMDVDDTLAEQSIYWIDAATGELCRCRPDFWRRDGIVVDVKTTEDASPDGFAKSVATYRYHVQDPWYLGGMNAAYEAGHFPEGWAAPKAFLFLAVEKKAPHAVAVYALDEESRAIGATQMRQNLDKLAECKRTGKWPGYGDFLQTLGVPQWYLNRNAALIGAA